VEKRDLSYVVKIGMVRIGRAKWHVFGKTRLDGIECEHLQVEVRTPQLKDKEDIYLDEKTLYPYKIFRQLTYLGMSEEIIEDYNYADKEVRITKNGKQIAALKQSLPIDNVFAFIYRLWQQGQRPQTGMKLQLPKQLLEIIVGKDRVINTRIGRFSSVMVSSRPKKVIVFFRKEDMLPVLIKGAIPILPYNLTVEK